MPVNSSNRESARFRALLSELGRNAVHAIFPKDFEAYYIFMELVDSQNQTEALITWPVQPEQISETAQRITNIKKTASGVVAVSTDSFVPVDIEIRGNFGRSFKFTIGNKFIDGGLLSFGISKLITKVSGLEEEPTYVSFSNVIKTGYGITKAIETMLDASEKLDRYGKPKRLFLYNTVLGNNYQVKVKSWTHSQNMSQNMIPQYNLRLTGVSPLSAAGFGQFKKLGQGLLIGTLNKIITGLAKSIASKL